MRRESLVLAGLFLFVAIAHAEPNKQVVDANDFSPMTLAQMVDRLHVFDPLPLGTRHRNPQGAGVDQGFVLGYMTAVQELSGQRLQGTFYEQRNALKNHLIRHPEDGNQPVYEVMIRVLKGEQ